MTYTTDEKNEIVKFADKFLADEDNRAVIDSGWDYLLRHAVSRSAENYYGHVDDELFDKLVDTVRHRSKLEAKK